jgi:hypothetical protein
VLVFQELGTDIWERMKHMQWRANQFDDHQDSYMSNTALIGVSIKFICEDPHSHSQVEIGMLLTMLIRGKIQEFSCQLNSCNILIKSTFCQSILFT